MNKKLLIASLLLLICVLLTAATITVYAGTYIITSDWSFEIPSATNTTEYYIEEYLGTETNVVIPDVHNDRTIVKINSNSFKGVAEYCLIPATVVEISNNAFLSCETLKSITIPKTVEVIGSSAFANCTGMESFVVQDKTALKYIPASCCNGNTALTEVYIGSGVEAIYKYAFSNCESLEKIVIPPSVNSIASKTFTNSSNVTLYVYDGSYALQYAIDNNIPYVNLGQYVEPTEPQTTTTVATEPSSTEEATSSSVITEPTEVTSSTADAQSSSATDSTEPTETSGVTVTTDPSENSTSSTEDASSGGTDESVTTEPTETSGSSAGTESTSTTASDTSLTQTTTDMLNTYYVGDADIDGRITVKDATIIQKHVAKLLTFNDVQLILADANADENVSVKDATQIQKFVAGFKDILYVGNEVKL